MTEFELIESYFRDPRPRDDIRIGSGDDCAVLRVPQGMELAISMDALVADVHFSRDDDPGAIGHKAVAVNLSDLAAMGAKPVWITMSLTLPEIDTDWITAFREGVFELCEAHSVRLVGGDLSSGPLSITIQSHGLVEAGQALTRQGARPGDIVCVTGSCGDAGLALKLRQELGRAHNDPDRFWLDERLDRPTPRIEAGLGLRGRAHAAIDISDGLVSDLCHILESSQPLHGSGGELGAIIDLNQLPLSQSFLKYTQGMDTDEALRLALAFGDDYELCFTLPPTGMVDIQRLSSECGLEMTPVGTITLDDSPLGIRLRRADGSFWGGLSSQGFEHFRQI